VVHADSQVHKLLVQQLIEDQPPCVNCNLSPTSKDRVVLEGVRRLLGHACNNFKEGGAVERADLLDGRQ